jgi:hypothetical protein
MLTTDIARMTMDGSFPIPSGSPFEHAVRTHDGKTTDSTGAFLVGELERLDQTLHEPLADVSWGRDIDLREDVTIGDEVSAFTLSTYGSTGSLGTGSSIGTGKAWVGKETTQITGLSVDIGKYVHSLRLWAQELKYTIPELASAAQAGRPIDQQKFEGLQLKHQMDIDEQVYYGDTVFGDTGLVNCVDVTAVATVPTSVNSGNPTVWSGKTPQEVLSDVNLALTTVWQNSAFAIMPSRILLPTSVFGYISTALISTAGNQSILKYVLENNLLTSNQGSKLEILPAKWCNGTGVGGTPGNPATVNRMVVYTKDKRRVRYPMTMLQRTPVQYDGLYHKTTYFCRLGVVEAVYPATLGYFDGI